MIERDCDNCGQRYTTKSGQSKFCKDLGCGRERVRLRKRKFDGKNVVPFTPGEGTLTTAARARLTEGGMLETDAGRLVLHLAERLDGSSKDTGSSFAALSREYRTAMAEAMKDAAQQANPISTLREAASQRRLSVVR